MLFEISASGNYLQSCSGINRRLSINIATWWISLLQHTKIIFEKLLVRKVVEKGCGFLVSKEKFPISSLEDVTCPYILKIIWKPVWYRGGVFKICFVQLANLMCTPDIYNSAAFYRSDMPYRKFLWSAVAHVIVCMYMCAKRDTITRGWQLSTPEDGLSCTSNRVWNNNVACK